MVEYFIYLIFTLSVALAAGGVILSTRLRNKFQHNIFSTLLYYQVFIFTFGFYGIWGQVVIKSLLSAYISEELLIKFTDISMLLGLPFLVFAWLMLIRFAFGISGRKTSNWQILWFLLVNFSIIFIVGYIITKANEVKPVYLIRYYFIIMNTIYSLLTILLIIFSRKGQSLIHAHDRRMISAAIVIIMIAQCVPLYLYSKIPATGIIFILTFFAGNTFIPVYLSYGTIISALASEPLKDLSFDEFCKKFEVSPRETDIIREICNGLSNKEISEKLFISIQTVKDHTHRIYIKTNVKSRVQLITLVRELIRN